MHDFHHLRKSALGLALCLFLSFCQVIFAEEVFDVDLAPGTPLVDAIRSVGYRAGRNIVINGDLSGTVSLSLEGTTFNQVLSLLSMTHGFTFKDVNGVVIVSPSKDMSDMKTFKLNYLDPEFAKKEMGLIFKQDQIYVNTDTNTVTVNGSSGQIAQAKTQLKTLDVAQPQISVKATVIELTHSKARELGLSFATDAWTKNTEEHGWNGVNFAVTAAHEDTIGKGNILARPTITVFNGRKAHILMGDKVPVFTSTNSTGTTTSSTSVSVEYKDVGVSLDVTPRINDPRNENITMNIKPTISTITKWVESGNNKAPQISTREADTMLRVKSGQTILLGGLLRDEDLKNVKEVPFLSKLPFFGELFKMRSNSKVKTEIVIAITPTILSDVNDAPFVEKQEMAPSLHRKLNELQREKHEANVQPEVQDEFDSENAELTRKLKAEAMAKKKLQAQLAKAQNDLMIVKEDQARAEQARKDKALQEAAAAAARQAAADKAAKDIETKQAVENTAIKKGEAAKVKAVLQVSKEEKQVAADLKAWNEKIKSAE
jgi:type II secretory pathway component GspD/PulD (secretin)